MKNKLIVIAAAAGLLLIVSNVIFFKLYFNEKATSNRRFDDIQALTAKAQQFTTRDDHQATKTKALDLTPMETKKAFPEVARQLNNLYIKPRLAESFTQASAQTNIDLSIPIKDSTVTRITPGVIEKIEPIKTFKFRDPWISISGQIDPDTAKIKVAAIDSIFTAIYHGERRHPWAWIFSKRQLQVAATNRSPYIKIQVIQAGIIKR
jgi:hypothetical protein